jgi:hypothetical protein
VSYNTIRLEAYYPLGEVQNINRPTGYQSKIGRLYKGILTGWAKMKRITISFAGLSIEFELK